MVFNGPRSLENTLREYAEQYHTERNHQELGNELIEPADGHGAITGSIAYRERFVGMLKYHHPKSA